MCVLLVFVEGLGYFFVIGFIVTGFLLFGAEGYLMYHKLQELLVAIGQLRSLHKGMCCAMSTQTHALYKQNHRLDALAGKLSAVSELVGEVGPTWNCFQLKLVKTVPDLAVWKGTAERLKADKIKALI